MYVNQPSFYRAANLVLRCYYTSWKRMFPMFFKEHKNAIDIMGIVAKRYGLELEYILAADRVN